jgi:hypothetical protein
MSERLRTALSVTALVVAVLGWSPLGEAAREAAFPPNSVGTDQLKLNAVTSPKIRNGSVTAIDVQKKSLTGAHIKPGSLLASSFKAGQLPAGPKGDKGDKGDKGANGLANAYTKQTSGPTQALTTTPTAIVTLSVPRGRYLILGKVWVSGPEPTFTAICNVVAGGDQDTGLAGAYSGPAGANVSDTMSMHVVHTFAAAGTTSISCSRPATRTGSWGEATLTAIQVG